MQLHTTPHKAAVSPRLSPVQTWQTLLTYLLEQHYGLELNDTPFGHDDVIQKHIDAGIILADAINTVVEKYDLVRTDRRGFSCLDQSPFITLIDILRAKKAIGLMVRGSYRVATDVTRSLYHQGAKS